MAKFPSVPQFHVVTHKMYCLLRSPWLYLLKKKKPTRIYKTYRQAQQQQDPHHHYKLPQATYIGAPARTVVSKRGSRLVYADHMKMGGHYRGAVSSACLVRLFLQFVKWLMLSGTLRDKNTTWRGREGVAFRFKNLRSSVVLLLPVYLGIYASETFKK